MLTVLLCLVASKPTDAVTYGFLPAAARLGLDVHLLTDQPTAHQRVLAQGPPGRSGGAGPRIVACAVRDAFSLIGRIAGLPAPAAVFSNSDRLQAQTALAADYFGVPGKDWRSCLRAKDKLLMRRRLAETGAESLAVTEITVATAGRLPALCYPVVLKPAEGVASEDVVLVRSAAELARRCAEIFSRRPAERLIAEEYLPGTLRTLETLGDGRSTWVLGGFRTDVSAPPFFVEERLTWDPLPPGHDVDHVRAALADLGVSFGACHTEFMSDGQHGARLIEVNDRLIGDHGDFLLGEIFGVDLFEQVLRVHLGESLPAGPLPAVRSHAIADYVMAERPGVLVSCPPAGPRPGAEPGVRLSYWPLRRPGEHITLTCSNRDYLGVLTATGSGAAATERSVAAARTLGGSLPPWWPDPAAVGLPAALAGTHDLMPVHPLTARLALSRALAEAGLAEAGLAEAGLAEAGAGAAGHRTAAAVAPGTWLRVRPTLSTRTVAVTSHPAAHLKLPLPTSTLGWRNRRSIKPGTMADGALVRGILATAVATDAELGRLLLADDGDYAHAGHPYLGYLLRRLPGGLGQCRIVPVAALLAPAGPGRLVIDDLAGGSLTGSFRGYLDLVFGIAVRLFARYGIALESHQQNAAVVLGPPGPRLLVKDFDGALLNYRRLAAALGPAAPAERQFSDGRMLTGSDEALADVFITITVHLCAGALAFGLAERGRAPLGDLLMLVRRSLAAALDRQAGAPAAGLLRARVLDADRLPVKAMVTAGTLMDKSRTGACDINKFYRATGPNYLRPGAHRDSG